MTNWSRRFIVFILTIGLLGACAANNDNQNQEPTAEEETNQTEQSEEAQEENIVVTLSKDDGEEIIEEKEIPIEEGAILMDVMKANFDIKEDGGFIHSIEGVAPEKGEEKAWMYFVNNEMPMVGASEFELSAGDEVTFDLQSYE
ncbi:DUF4430 domain-containing protein [Virgibacillus sp. W0181]|uniref:DUF4430 domain-containing protein n=1 Tax=Virgibacillus sp. W0181 TaxID=3391581 RepID=UPI003F485BC3